MSEVLEEAIADTFEWTPENANVVWQPIRLPNGKPSSQMMALNSRAHHTLYTGARGPGKTDTQLMRFRRNVGVGYGSFWKGIIFDREYKHLADLISKSKRWFYAFKDGAKFIGGNELKWVWPTGEELLFRICKKESDYYNYHGHEYPFIGWNELTKYPNSECYDIMMSVNRSSFRPEKDAPLINWERYSKTGQIEYVESNHPKAKRQPLAPIPLEVFSTCNPYGAGHNWVKHRFIDPAPYGTVVRRKVASFDPKTQQDIEIEITQVTIFGSFRENIYLDPKYIAELNAEKNENRRKAWLLGDWDIVAGGAFDDVWNKAKHVLPLFEIPKSWHLNRSFDWGSTDPFSVGWWAEANGEEATLPDGTKFCPPRGSLIQIAEWYGSKEIGSGEGMKLGARKIAEGIRDTEIKMLNAGFIASQPWAGPADNQIRNKNEAETQTIEDMMKDIGIQWTQSDKSPGSRKIGLELMRERLRAVTEGENKPGLYFMEHCRASISLIPVLPRDEDDPDDVDTDAEDHSYDMVRYRVLVGNNRTATAVKISFAR